MGVKTKGPGRQEGFVFKGGGRVISNFLMAGFMRENGSKVGSRVRGASAYLLERNTMEVSRRVFFMGMDPIAGRQVTITTVNI